MKIQNNMKLSFVALKEWMNNRRRTFASLLLTSLCYRVVAFSLFVPLISGLAAVFFKASGRLIIADEEIVAFILQPIGFFAIIFVATCSLTLIALEQACLMLVQVKKDAGIVRRVRSGIKDALTRISGILELALRVVLGVFVYSAPCILLVAILLWALLSRYDINYYLATRPPEFTAAMIGVGLICVGLFILLIRYAVGIILALPIFLFQARKPSQALAESRLKAQGHHLFIALSIGAWWGSVLTASGLIAACFFWVGRLSAPIFLKQTFLLLPFLGLLVLGFILSQLLLSLVATPGFSLLVMHLYGLPISGETELDRPTQSATAPQDQEAGGGGRWLYAGLGLCLCLATVTGWLLLTRASLDDRTEVVAHRGASGSAPENTLAAIRKAIDLGAHWVEIDVQRTADDRVVVVHDRDLMRIGGSPLVVTQARYAQLVRIDVGSWFHPRFADQRISTLETVLKYCKKRIKVNIELKYYAWDPLLAERVIDVVEGLNMEQEVVLMSLKPEALAQIRSKRPHWRVGLLAATALTDLTQADVDFLALHSRMVTPGLVRRVHRQGKTIKAWTINDPVGMTHMFGMGVEAIMTDAPGLAIGLLEQRAEMDPVERMLMTAGLIMVGQPGHVDPKTDGM